VYSKKFTEEKFAELLGISVKESSVLMIVYLLRNYYAWKIPLYFFKDFICVDNIIL